ncbi:MAG: YkgJ family cysteine cluster protein [Anaerovoracaceae bacterium]
MLSENKLQSYLDCVLGMDDTFEFECKQCGKCCRERSEPIILTGYDIYNASKYLNISTLEFVAKYTRGYTGENSHLPIVVLKERQYDNTCPMLRGGKCTIQAAKPLVCRLYPLGRLYDSRDGEYKYFAQKGSCEGKKVKTTLRGWLETFDIQTLDCASRLWTSFLMSAVNASLSVLDNPEQLKKFQQSVLFMAYVNFVPESTYEEQMARNIKELEKRFSFFKMKS